MGRARFLTDAQGVRLPSVTAILNATKPPEDREALARWRDRVGSQEATRIATAASRRGSQTHKHLCHYLRGEPRECPELVKPYWESLASVLAELGDVQIVEEKVFHYDLAYAGQVDCVASYRGQPCVVDWKTADAPKQSVERLYDGPLQLAAYCGAVNHAFPQLGAELNQAMLVVAVPHQPAEVFWFEPEALSAYWAQWQRRVDQYYGYRRWR
ncbi:PD-(D/E)XK nuclease family protein [Leptolyngbya sp. AN02str]|uniref:PD-(D/E)XK nuclease family protein n=1 Tax=Leptolyngbya sp. AN02str TaxID=3423363 RepID=UPI003D312572